MPSASGKGAQVQEEMIRLAKVATEKKRRSQNGLRAERFGDLGFEDLEALWFQDVGFRA